jgi:thioredoxin reductase
VSYRRDRFSRIKPGNRERIEAAMADSRLEVHWATSVDRVERGRVWLTGASDRFAVDNDQVFVFAGGELPTPFLKSCGVEIDTKFGAP